MRFKYSLITIFILLAGSMNILAQEHSGPPRTKEDPVTETIHGVTITDPYQWLEDQNSPQTRQWIKEQNDYTRSVLDPLPGRQQIHDGLEKLLKVDSIGTPFERGGRYFFSRRKPDQNQAVVYMRQGFKGKDEVLIDPNQMSADQSVSVSVLGLTDDGKLLVYGVRHGGQDEVKPTLMDVDSRKTLSDDMPQARYSGIELMPDHSGFYYSKFVDHLPYLFYHKIGTDASKDVELFGKGFGPTDIIGASLSDDAHYLIIFVNHGAAADNTKVYFKDLTKDGPITPIVDNVQADFGGEAAGGRLFLRTNWDAPNSKIVVVDLKDSSPEHWKVVVPESQYPLESFSLAGGKLFVRYLQDVVTHIKVYDPSGKLDREIDFPTKGTAGGMSGRWSSTEAFYTFTSFAVPTTIYRYDVSSGKQEVWARINVPIDSSSVETKQVWYASKDGTKIPMFLVYKKGLKLDGDNPTYLTAYGGFNLSMTPGFSPLAAFWVQNGGVFAEPNLRGGGEFGEKWHRAGMLENKQNVFDDFIAAAEWLIKNKYTRTEKLAISGGSNGGLLVGAAMTQRPDLYKAVLCSFPLLDMIRYQNFLVARFWVPEYGSSENPDQFKYILKYSPYHNVKKGTKYPAVMFISGDFDTRVAPLHARKMAALVQASTGSDNPVLLHYDTEAGHSGGEPVSKQVNNMTDEMNFLFWQLGMTAK